MKQQWDADITIDEKLVLSLLRTQFPELSPFNLEFLGTGWDNSAWFVNQKYVFRFPRRLLAVDWLKTENSILPPLSKKLSINIPTPTLIGNPSKEFPWVFAGYRHLTGVTGCRAQLSVKERISVAKPIAQFLKKLHNQRDLFLDNPLLKPDQIGRLDTGYRLPICLEKLPVMTDKWIIQPESWVDLLYTLAENSSASSLTLVHGDLYSRHLLMDEKTRKLSGVIDWGDVHLGDPAIDISIALTFLPREGRQIFAEAYGDISTPQWNLAFFRALVHNFTILEYSETISDVALLRESRIALYNILDNYQDLALGKNYSPRELLVP